MRTKIFQVDAFTSEPFSGNPAGVCVLTRDADDHWMQAVAAEINASETAFLVKRNKNEYDIRYFTPLVEVPLCGHATLASAHLLWEEGHVPLESTLTLNASGGTLKAHILDGWIHIDFPSRPVEQVEIPPDLAQVVGTEIRSVHQAGFCRYLVELESEDAVRSVEPDFTRLKALFGRLIITARADLATYDFVSRFFAPAVGVDEDPVTGVAHLSLGPFWADRLKRNELVGYQASRRGGLVKVHVLGQRVELAGQAVTTIRGTLEH